MEYAHRPKDATEQLRQHPNEPVIEYFVSNEGSTYERTFNTADADTLGGSSEYIVGHDAVIQHVESLLEKYEASTPNERNLGCLIDAVTIIQELPSLFGNKLPDALHEEIFQQAVARLDRREDRIYDEPEDMAADAALVIHLSQIPEVYERLRAIVQEHLKEHRAFRQHLEDPLLRAFASAFSEMHLDYNSLDLSDADGLHALLSQ